MATATADHADHHDDHEDDGNWGTSGNQNFAQASPGKIAMWFFLVSDGFSFSGLLLAYALLRGGSEIWISATEPQFGLNFTAGLTFLLICSSVTMVMAHQATERGDRKNQIKFLALTVIGGALFMCGQMQEYFGVFHWLPIPGVHHNHGLIAEGLIWGQSHRATTFYLITSFHGAHVTTGVLYLTIMLIQSIRGKIGKHNSTLIEIAGLFWHFVDLVWIMVFTLVYLL